ncbi:MULTISPECIES: cytochrome P450 [Gordonia]|nr:MULTISPECIES: cytochrome P450 [Gordonia]
MSTTEMPHPTTTDAPAEYPFGAVTPTEAGQRYRAIAVDRPMTKVTMPFGGDVWVIHRNSAARQMLADSRFVREPFRTGERVVPYFVEFPDFLKTTIQFEDPPHHTKLRKLVQRSISPKRVKAMRDSAIEFANHLIDEMVAKGGPVNLVEEYTVALPIQMLANLLGVPPEDRPKFQKWSSSTLAVANMPEEEVVANMTELVVYMMALIEERRREPREDLLSDLANARDKDDSLTDGEILPIALVLIIGGFDNTANFIGAGVLSLLRNPDQLEVFLSDPDGVAPTAVEEILRHGRMAIGDKVTGGGGMVPFVATEDVTIEGQFIAKGEAALFDPMCCGHDGVALEHDDVFDIRRENNPHLTLSYGMHHCLGAPLARMEMQVGLAELYKRIPELTLAGEAIVDKDNLTQAITDLPVTW